MIYSPDGPGLRKIACFRASLAYNRGLHELSRHRELWSDIRDGSGQDTRIILGQLPSEAWACKDEHGNWGSLGSASFADFMRQQNIRGVLSIVEPFEWHFA